MSLVEQCLKMLREETGLHDDAAPAPVADVCPASLATTPAAPGGFHFHHSRPILAAADLRHQPHETKTASDVAAGVIIPRAVNSRSPFASAQLPMVMTPANPWDSSELRSYTTAVEGPAHYGTAVDLAAPGERTVSAWDLSKLIAAFGPEGVGVDDEATGITTKQHGSKYTSPRSSIGHCHTGRTPVNYRDYWSGSGAGLAGTSKICQQPQPPATRLLHAEQGSSFTSARSPRPPASSVSTASWAAVAGCLADQALAKLQELAGGGSAPMARIQQQLVSRRQSLPSLPMQQHQQQPQQHPMSKRPLLPSSPKQLHQRLHQQHLQQQISKRPPLPCSPMQLQQQQQQQYVKKHSSLPSLLMEQQQESKISHELLQAAGLPPLPKAHQSSSLATMGWSEPGLATHSRLGPRNVSLQPQSPMFVQQDLIAANEHHLLTGTTADKVVKGNLAVPLQPNSPRFQPGQGDLALNKPSIAAPGRRSFLQGGSCPVTPIVQTPPVDESFTMGYQPSLQQQQLPATQPVIGVVHPPAPHAALTRPLQNLRALDHRRVSLSEKKDQPSPSFLSKARLALIDAADMEVAEDGYDYDFTQPVVKPAPGSSWSGALQPEAGGWTSFSGIGALSGPSRMSSHGAAAGGATDVLRGARPPVAGSVLRPNPSVPQPLPNNGIAMPTSFLQRLFKGGKEG